MPIYEYECIKCGHHFEELQKASDKPLKKCPECHNGTLQKLVSSSSFQLKGTGWYATDFKNKTKEQNKTTGTADKKPETKSSDTSSKTNKTDD